MSNPYDDLLDAAPPSPTAVPPPAAPVAAAPRPAQAKAAPNPYLDLIPDNTGQAALAVGLSSDRNASAAATDMALARKYKTTPQVVSAFPDDFRQRAQLELARDSLSKAPALSKAIVTNPALAAAAHPEVPQLSLVNQAVDALGKVARYVTGADSGRSAGQDLLAIGLGASRAVSPVFGKVFLAAGGLASLADTVDKNGVRSANLLSDAAFKAADFFDKASTANAPAAGAGLWDKALDMAGQTGGVVMQALATGGEAPIARAGASIWEALGGMAAHGVRSMTVPATMASDKTYADVIAQGGTVAEATKAASAAYLTTTLGGVLPMATPGKLAFRLGAGAASGTLQGEVNRQIMSAALPDSMQPPEPTTDDRILEALAGAVFGGLAGPHDAAAMQRHATEIAKRTYVEAAQVEHAKQGAEAIGKISELAANSELRKNSPDTFKQLVRDMTDDAGTPELYVDAKHLAQALDTAGLNAAFLQEHMPEVAGQMREGLQSEGMIRIPVEDYATHIAGTPADANLQQHLRVDPEGKTFGEAQQAQTADTARFQAEAEKVLTQHAKDSDFRAGAKEVHDDILGQLKAVNRFPSDVNKAYAAMTRDFYTALADRLGVTPKEALDRYPLQVRAEALPGGGAAFAQGYSYEWAKAEEQAGRESRLTDAVLSGESPETVARIAASLQGAHTEVRYTKVAPPVPAKTAPPARTVIAQAASAKEGPRAGDLGLPTPEVYRKLGQKGMQELAIASDAMGNVFTPDEAREAFADVLHKLKRAGVTEVDFYHVTNANDFGGEGIKGSAVTNRGEAGENSRARAVYGFLDPSDIPSGFAGVLGTTGDKVNVAHVKLPVDDIVGLTWDSNFNVTFGTYSGVYLKGDVKPSLIKSISKVDLADATPKADGGTFKQAATSARFSEDNRLSNLRIDGPSWDRIRENNPALKNVRSADADVTIYRATVGDSIRPDDFVAVSKATLKKELANVKARDGAGAKILELKVKARDLLMGNDATEFVYFPKADGGTFDAQDPSILNQEARGQIQFGADTTQQPSVVTLFKGADLTTFLHESGHFFLEVYSDVASRADAPPLIAKDMGALLDWFGVKADGDPAEAVVNVVKRGGDFDARATLAALPPVREGFARLFRAESPTVKFSDVFKAEGLKTHDPQGRPGQFYTDDIFVADYYRASYGRDAVITFVDVPTAVAKTARVGEGEFVVDPAKAGADPLTAWRAMTPDAKREFHEKFARGFEAYLMEGKAPTPGLQGLFSRFASWLVQAYKSVAGLNVELTPEVRGVMDRMLASEETIRQSEDASGMAPMFSERPPGMDAEAFARYQALGQSATDSAVADLQHRGARDMKWLSGAQSEALKAEQAKAAGVRREERITARREVMAQPVYRAWMFLTGKMQEGDRLPSDKVKFSAEVDPARDNLLVAMAKLGGLDRASAAQHLGVHPDNFGMPSGVFGKRVFRKEGGVSADHMLEMLQEQGYFLPDEYGRSDMHAFEERLQEQLAGQDHHSVYHDYTPEARQGERANFDQVQAGRLDLADLKSLGLDGGIVAALEARKMTAKNGAIHPDVLAEVFGFSSGHEMAEALAKAEAPQSAVESRTDQRMLAEHGDLIDERAVAKAASAAIHSEVRLRFLATELRTLAQATGSARATAQAAKQAAEASIAVKRVRDLRPSQYEAAEARAGKASVEAFKKGDTQTAAVQKRAQILSHALAKAAGDAQAEAEKAVKYLKKFEKEGVRKALPADYLVQIDALLEKHDLRQTSMKAADEVRTLRTWVQSRLNAGEIPPLSENLLSPKERKAYQDQISIRDENGNLVFADPEEQIKLLADAIENGARTSHIDLTVEALRGLHDTVRTIEHMGRQADEILTAEAGATYQGVRGEIVASLEQHAKRSGLGDRTSNTRLGEAVQGVKQFAVSHLRPATWAQIMDGGEANGPLWKYLIKPANARQAHATTRKAQATEALAAVLSPILKDVTLYDKAGKGKYFKELGTSLNWQERFAFLLNYGNESNLQRLKDGGIAGVTKALTDAQIQTVLRTMTAAELRAAQAVWDHLETYRPEVGALERKMVGKEPEWIQPRPFSVRSVDGEVVHLKGGYYPVVFDPRGSLQAQQHAQAQEAKALSRAAYSAATTARTFTKQRVDEVVGRPLMLNLSGLYRGVNDVVHDLSFREWSVDANKLLRSKTIDASIRDHYGPEVKRTMEQWRDDLVGGTRRLDHGVEQALSFARRHVSMAGLSFNVMSAAIQPLGITQSMARIGVKWTAKGVAEYVARRGELTQEVHAQSEFMRNRGSTAFRELAELGAQVKGQTKWGEFRDQYAFWLTAASQGLVDIPTWKGAHLKALAEGFDDATAVHLADQAVKDSQGGGETVDLSGIERGPAAVKVFSVFYGFMSTALNTGALATVHSSGKADLAIKLALTAVIPTVLGKVFRDAVTPGDSGNYDDLEKTAKTLISEQAQFLLGLVVFAREFSGVTRTLTGDKDMGYSGPVGLRMIPDAGKLAKQAMQGEFDTAFRKALLNFCGDLLGIPSAQINKTWTGMEALANGDTENPMALIAGYQKPN